MGPRGRPTTWAIGAVDQRADAPKYCKDKDLQHGQTPAVAHLVALPRAAAPAHPGSGGSGEGADVPHGEPGPIRGDGAPIGCPVGCMAGATVGVTVACMVTGADAGTGGGADAVPAGPDQANGFLARLVASWPTLSEPVKAGIRAMVEAASR